MDKELLLAAIQKNPEQVTTVSRNLEAGERELVIALKGNTIKNSPISSLNEVLRFVMVKVGIRAQNIPNKEETAVLIDHITTNYGNHTVKEIKLAFDMAIAGKLDIDRKEVVCYENFSCLYFSTTMNAYRDWAKEAVMNVPKETPAQKIYTDKEILNQRRGEIESAYQAIRTGHTPIIHVYFWEVLAYDELESTEDSIFYIKKESVEDFFVRKINSGAENIYTKS